MSLVTGLLNQTAVYWGSPVADGYGGFSYASPVEIACRFEDGTGLSVGADGETKPPSSSVWSETALVSGGMIFLGTLADLSAPQKADPETVSTAHRLKSVNVMWDLDGSISHYEAAI